MRIQQVLWALCAAMLAQAGAAEVSATKRNAESVRLAERGSLVVDFVPPVGILPLSVSGQSPAQIPLVDTPLFRAAIRNTEEVVSLDLHIMRRPPLAPIGPELAQIMWSRLDQGKRYQLVFVWSVPENRFDVYLNGTLQEATTQIAIPFWESGTPPLEGRLVLGDKAERARLFDRVLNEEEIARMAAEAMCPALTGEGRTILSGGIEVVTAEPVFVADFSRPLDVVREDEMFVEGRRTREPEAEWVLEGEGKAFTRDGWLVLETGRWTPPSRWEDGKPVWESPSHLVLWLNRRLPDRTLVDYEIEVEDPDRGLHILFFAASGPDGGSIFQPGLSRRNADFGKYIRNPGEFLSYHISPWAAPYDLVRRSSNLRRNGRFTLLASGDDRIATGGAGPHRIRLLKDGSRIVAEVNGTKILDYTERDEFFGGPLSDGYLGLRLMGFSRWMKIRGLRVERLGTRE